MNTENLQIIFRNYIDKFDLMNDPEHDETYKWEAIQHFQDHWDIDAEDFGTMFKIAVKATFNLINNSIVQPTNGIVELAKFETETVRDLFKVLYSDDQGDLDTRQKRIDDFVSQSNLLLEKYAPGKWKFKQDTRTAIFYLNLKYPDDNFIYKASQTSTFSRCVEYGNEIGGGQSFKLKHYYFLCEWLVEELKKAPEILAIHQRRYTREIWPDEKLHILAYDIIYCAVHYNLYLNTVIKPRDKKGQIDHAKQQRTRDIELQLIEIQSQLDAVQEQMSQFEHLSFNNLKVQHKRFGEGIVLAQEKAILTIQFAEGEKRLVLPDIFVNQTTLAEDPEIIEYYLQMHELQKQEQQLKIQVQALELEMK